MVLTREQALSIADPERIWQVRRFCQVRSGSIPHGCDQVDAPHSATNSDAALSALLRCLMVGVDADLAALSLLDEQNQYFLSVVHAANTNDPTIGYSDWFGCEQILFDGGICERTITHDYASTESPVFEILDLQASEATKSLPVVNGALASFGYYAGAPITTPQGMHVGALFVFKKNAMLQPLAGPQRQWIARSARHTMDHLTQVLAAIENARCLDFNMATFLLPGFDKLEMAASAEGIIGSRGAVEKVRADMYDTATALLSRTLGLEKVYIRSVFHQEDLASPSSISRNLDGGVPHSNPADTTMSLPPEIVDELMSLYPSGVVLRLYSTDDGGIFIPSSQQDSQTTKKISLKLCALCPGIQQCIYMPLQDSFSDEPTAFIFGWTPKFSRVYSGKTDLPSLSSFGISLMTGIRRLEARAMARKQADFLGSVSHEMRSPLHGMLACIEYLQETDCSAQQYDWLESAAACGLQLKNNIDNVLQISRIADPTRQKSDVSHGSSSAIERLGTSQHDSLRQGPSTKTFLNQISDAIDEAMRLHQCAIKSLQSLHENTMPHTVPPKAVTLVTLDATMDSQFCTDHHPELDTIIRNLCHNCLKFARAGTCVRISVHIDREKIKITFRDSGRGIPQEFLQHGLCKPFSQQDPLDDGLGLGLVLVNSAIRSLEGDIAFESDESTGTEVCVSFPRRSLASARCDSPAARTPSPGVHPVDVDDFPSEALLFAPRQWMQESDVRHKRSTDALADSLSRTLDAWFGMRLRMWSDGWESSNVVLVAEDDLSILRERAGDAFTGMWKIILCESARLEVDPSASGVIASVSGPIHPFKLQSALFACRSQAAAREPKILHAPTIPDTPTASPHSRTDSPTLHSPTDDDGQSPKRRSSATKADEAGVLRDPRFLLVDDNAINLKVISMFAKKCSREASTLVGSGQGAIDAFQSTQTQPDCPAFDIVVLDLSMPEVSGFEVASAIRTIERSKQPPSRIYIAALTGLVSDKDRRAAFAAGVDEYVTKPASIQDLKRVVCNWRNAVNVS